MFTIKEIDLSQKRERRKFIETLWIVKDSFDEETQKNWVAPLRVAVDDLLNPKHPFYQHAEVKAFIAERKSDGKSLGRILAIENQRYNQFNQANVGFFGFYECIEYHEVSTSLLQAAEDFCRERGLNQIVGPVNPSTNYEAGLLIEGNDDPPQIMMTYNPKYYHSQLEQFGLVKAKDLLAYKFIVDQGMPEVIHKVASRVENSKGVTYRSVSKKRWDEDIKTIQNIYNQAWEKNWGFVPMTDEEFTQMGKEMKMILDTRYALIAEVNGEAAGFILTLPDINQILQRIPSGKLLPTGIFKLLFGTKSINRTRTLTLGVLEKYRRMGLETCLYLNSWKVAKSSGMKEAEFSWILEDNELMNRPIKKMGATPYKTYRLFKKDI